MSFILENKLGDPFMANRNSTKSLKPQTDLFRAPVPIDQLFNSKPSVLMDISPYLGLMALIGQTLGLLGLVTSKAHIAPDLAANSRFVTSQYHGYPSLIMPCLQQGSNLVFFFLGKLRVSHSAPYSCRIEKALMLPQLTFYSSSRVALTS